MEFKQGQLVVILAPFMEYEVYAQVKQDFQEKIMLELKTDAEVPLEKEILCIVVDNENMFEFYTQIITKNENLIFVKRPEPNEYSAIEKRKFNRVDCNIGFVATPISINDVLIPHNDKKFIGTIRNISGGGVLIETNLNLPVDMVFAFKLKLNFFVDCKARIVRTENVFKDGFQSGCQFVDNSLDNIKTISLYAFKERLRQKRKELNQRKTAIGGKILGNES